MLPSKAVLILVTLTIGLSVAQDKTEEKTNKSDRSDFKKSFSKDCATSYTTTCLKLDIVSWVDQLDENDELSVIPGVSVVKENVSGDSAKTRDVIAELAREFPNDPDSRLDAYFIKKVTGYLDRHSLKLNLWNSGNGVEEGRGKGGGGGGGGHGGGGGGGKKGGGMGHILAAAAMMKGTLMAVAMAGIAVIAKKALIVGLISLVISAIIGLKALTHHGHHQSTVEVVAKPVYSHSNAHSVSHEEHGGGHYGHSSYGRSFDVPLPIGLQPGFMPEP